MDLQKLGMSPYGPATFGKSQLIDLDDDWAADVVFLGVPFDLGVGFRPGARWGPKAIRDMSVRFGSIGAGAAGFWDLRSRRTKGVCRAVDAGDVQMLPLDWEQNFEHITAAVSRIRKGNALPFVMGGDHSVTFPVLRAFEGIEPITVIHIDAHFDYRDEVMGVRYAHGNVLRRVRELPFVKRVVSVGVRSLRTRGEDVADFERDGNVCVPAWAIHEQGAGVLQGAIPTGESIYITFDIDGMDPSIAPGTGTPEMGGLDYEQARACLELSCTRNRLVGFDLVEVNPHFDPSAVTGLLSAQLMVEVLGFVFDG